MIEVAIALLAGILSFLSPCVLAMMPAYVGFISNDFSSHISVNRKFILKRALLFVGGFFLIFTFMGAAAGFIGSKLFSYRLILMKIGGIFIIIFGLKMIGLLKLNFLNRELRVKAPKKITRGIDSFLMGMAFATGWTPCVGPVLASILLYASTTATLHKGVLLLIMYSIGLALPFLATAMLINSFNSNFHKYSKISPIITKVGGVIMIIFGIIIYFNKMTFLNQYFDFIKIGI
ncbi:cytochrome c biogenesis CcdA family protein [Alkaliphilus peptidifermentans]|uniref:Cytochrome c-type biogenesis protein n=1 Tax=Alkaliphilus peptidifermentans DSM 18978 TaxID=1120976 RepID=A0A1G5HYZ2_9FIRM|nr:cytochrome c biogenesis CcdA family protein [Alkaliphilus peptidifermentans]SCY69023.1 cytochrome c-type biogenesis protein [Alkaliphilus peptidifermentans DSM 18978]